MNTQEIEFLVRFVCESDAIEGIVDDPKLVRAQFEEELSRGHVGALLLLDECASQKTLLTPVLVKLTQSLIVAEQHEKGERELAEKYRGNWRDCDVWIGGRKGASPEYVPSQMLALIERTVRWQAMGAELPAARKVADIAQFHYEYERIHPFADGNGRSGRALVYYLYRFAGLYPFIFTASDRHETYYRCFRDPARMSEYFLERTVFEV